MNKKNIFLWICIFLIVLLAVDNIGTATHEIYHYVQENNFFCVQGIYINLGFLDGGGLTYQEVCEDKDGNRVIPYDIEERNAQLIGWTTRLLSLFGFILILNEWHKERKLNEI